MAEYNWPYPDEFGQTETVDSVVSSEYLKAFPALEGKYSFHLCESADGVEL